MKPCKKCGSTEHAANGQCKPCKRLYDKIYRANNPVKIAATKAKCVATKPDKYREKNEEWHAENPESHANSVAKWQANNPDKIKHIELQWRLHNPEASRIKCHNYRAKKNANGDKLSKGLSAKLFKLQNGMCACGCGQLLGEKYELDHRMPIALGGTNTDDNMQLLTRTCNRQKSAKHPIDFMQSKGYLL